MNCFIVLLYRRERIEYLIVDFKNTEEIINLRARELLLVKRNCGFIL